MIAVLVGDQVQRFLVHGAGGIDVLALGALFPPGEAVYRSFIDPGESFQPLLE